MKTERIFDGRQFETLQKFGWRCGMYSLRADARWYTNNDFLSGLKSGRRQRQSGRDYRRPAAYLVLSLPHMVQLRRELQEAYGEMRWRSGKRAAAERHAERRIGEITCMGRDAGLELLSKIGDDAFDAQEWTDRYQELQTKYSAERARLMSKIGE